MILCLAIFIIIVFQFYHFYKNDKIEIDNE